nr:MAG TPA: hypothetical protein [Caudoviricetes sp.]
MTLWVEILIYLQRFFFHFILLIKFIFLYSCSG